jgi:hypothetical protein
MKIDSGLSGYYYPNRTVELERKQEEAPQREAATFTPSSGALTGSSTFPSSALAKALWMMDAGEVGSAGEQAASVKQDWIRDAYQEFA